MPRSVCPRRVPNTRLLLEHLEDRNLFDVAMGSLFSERLADPLAALAATHDNTGLPLGQNVSGHTRNLQAGPNRLVGTQNGSVVMPSNSGEHGAGDLTASGLPYSSQSEPLRPSATTMTGSVQMSWLGECRRVVPGSWVVQFGSQNGSIEASSLNSTLAAHTPGLLVASQVGSNGWFRITAPAEYTAENVAAAVGQAAPVLSIHPEFADYSVSTIPNDQYFHYQDSLHNTGANYGLPDADIDALEAWSHTGPDRGSTSVIVAVNDTGVDYTHPDLYLNIWINQTEIPAWVTAVDTDGDGIITFWDLNDSANVGVATDLNGTGYIDAGDILVPEAEGGWADGVDEGANGFTDDLIGWDFANGDNDPYDDNAHGTHVAGTIGAIGNNGVGVAGAVWKTQLMITAGLNWEGWGTDVDLAAAITYSVDNGARVTNASWGGEYSSLIDAAVVYAGAADHLVVAAAGNDFNDNDAFPDFSFPASLPYDNVLSVGSTDAYDYPSYFTNYGATSVDLMAPGDFVLSTVPMWWYGFDVGYEYFGGTSMAAPHVAGSAALLWATDPSANLADIRTSILNGVDLLPDLDPVTGFTPVASGGRLNLFSALQQLHPDGLFVLASTPSEGETVTGASPSEYTVTFNSAVQLSADPADLQASDFSVNGVPATGVTLSPDGLTATFTFNSDPITTEGLETMQLAAGSVRRIDTNGSLPSTFETSFRYDSVLLEVTGVEPVTGSVVQVANSYTFRYYFNEAIDPDSFYPGDEYGIWWTFLIENGIWAHLPSYAAGVPGNSAALDVTYVVSSTPNYTEGRLEAYFSSSTVTDIYGNRYDGSQFQSTYTTDITTRPYTVPIPAFAPLGSLAAGGATLNGYINPNFAGGDSDNFTVNLDAGQALTVWVAPASSAYGDPSGEVLRPRIEVYNSANILIGSADASAAGQRVTLQSIPVTTSGVYTMRVSGLGGTTGRYSFYVALNISLEEEQYLTFASNNSAVTAQSINSSFINLTTDLAKSSRGAVLGGVGNTGGEPLTTIFSADFESGDNGFTAVNDLGLDGYADGLWHRTDSRGNELGHSATHSFWYGNPDTGNYDTGFEANAGYLVSPVISLPNLPGQLVLDFNYLLRFDYGIYDTNAVEITSDGGATWTNVATLFSDVFSNPGWSNRQVSLAPFKGSDIQVRFAFDTHNDQYNYYEGLYIDDVRIYQTQPQDYYSFTAKAGEKIGLDITQYSGGVDPSLLKVELLASDGTTVLATGTGGATNVAGFISGVTIPADGTYFARVTSPVINSGSLGTVFYTMVVTRDAVFGLEPNNSVTTSQPLAGAKGALGYIESQPALNAADSGWYDWNGFHSPTNTNYFAGQFNNNVDPIRQLRDWFVFDVPSLSGTVTAARLELYLPGLVSPDPTETFELFDVSTPVSTLIAGGTGLTGIYDDLGTGVSYGSVSITAADNGKIVTINLNTAGLAAITAAQGSRLAIGGMVTTIAGNAQQSVFGGTGLGEVRRLVITTAAPSDWYSVTLVGDQTSLQVETRTPGDGAGEIRNTLNPRIEVYNASGTTLIASGTPLADGRNEKILVTGLTPGATYQVRIFGEGGTVGEYYMSATPLRVPTITSKVDDGLTNTAGPDGEFHVTNPDKNGWKNVKRTGWQNDYTIHQNGVSHTPNNVATWKIRATSANPELFVTWVPLPSNATNATYQVFKGNTLLATVVVNQQVLPNDGLLFGNTYVESLGQFSGIVVNSLLTVKLLTEGANGDVVADGVFDPPTGEELPAIQLVPGEELQAPILSHELQQIGGLLATTSSSWLVPGTVGQAISLESRTYGQVWRDRKEVDTAFIQQYQSVNERVYGVPRSVVESLLADTRALPIADPLFPLKRFPLTDSFDFENDL